GGGYTTQGHSGCTNESARKTHQHSDKQESKGASRGCERIIVADPVLHQPGSRQNLKRMGSRPRDGYDEDRLRRDGKLTTESNKGRKKGTDHDTRPCLSPHQEN